MSSGIHDRKKKIFLNNNIAERTRFSQNRDGSSSTRGKEKDVTQFPRFISFKETSPTFLSSFRPSGVEKKMPDNNAGFVTTKNQRDLMRYFRMLKRNVWDFVCPLCPPGDSNRIVAASYETHCANAHGLNPKVCCVWCLPCPGRPRASWPFRRKGRNCAHLKACFVNFRAKHFDSEGDLSSEVTRLRIAELAVAEEAEKRKKAEEECRQWQRQCEEAEASSKTWLELLASLFPPLSFESGQYT